jgi:ABC-type nickel/cobalt efflux system permease component RcnA
MDGELTVLYVTAASIGFLHTIFGPDHYLPFIVMSRARKWSLGKTSFITFLCGIGHIISSILLGIIGIVFGIAIMKLEALEAFRGNIAAWALIGFGFAYFVWGIRRAVRYHPHQHTHPHGTDTSHVHEHTHVGKHAHAHDIEKKSITPWILFTIFVLGPCEPLIPVLMYPAAKKSVFGAFMVSGVFGVVTIATMLGLVVILSLGVNILPLGKFERYTHALAGATIFLSGMAIQLLGL